MNDSYDRPSKLPERPEVRVQKSRTSWLPILMALMVGTTLAAILTVLTLGYFGPIVVIGLLVFAVIGIQYVLWGWLFERVYRSGPLPPDEDD